MIEKRNKLGSEADEKLRKRTIQAHHDEGIKKNGEGRIFQQPAALGFYAAIALARDCYEMGMHDASALIKCPTCGLTIVPRSCSNPACKPLLTADEVALKVSNVYGLGPRTRILQEWLDSHISRWKESELDNE